MMSNHTAAAAASSMAAAFSTNAVNTNGVASTPVVPKSLRYFDQLPDSANVRLPVVMALFGCSRATVWRRVKVGLWPSPLKFGGRLALWNVGQIRKLLNEGCGIQAS